MVIEIKKLASTVTVTRKSTDLFTRYVGKLLFRKINEKLLHITNHEVVIIDFDGIRSVDASFVDECIIPLLELSHNSSVPFYIKLVNITDNVEYIINQVITIGKENKRYIVITDRLCKNGCHALGLLSEIESDIIEYCVINKQISVDDVAQFLHLTSEEARHYLQELYVLRAIRKLGHDDMFYCL